MNVTFPLSVRQKTPPLSFSPSPKPSVRRVPPDKGAAQSSPDAAGGIGDTLFVPVHAAAGIAFRDSACSRAAPTLRPFQVRKSVLPPRDAECAGGSAPNRDPCPL